MSPIQTGGRFDLDCKPCVLYAAGTADQALAEKLQRYRGRKLGADHLQEWGQPLAVAQLEVPDELLAGLADLADPATLLRLNLRPDRLMSSGRKDTQAIARLVHDSGAPAFQCWSSIRGEWATTVLFLDRVPLARIRFAEPERIDLKSALLHRVAMVLGLEVGSKR